MTLVVDVSGSNRCRGTFVLVPPDGCAVSIAGYLANVRIVSFHMSSHSLHSVTSSYFI